MTQRLGLVRDPLGRCNAILGQGPFGEPVVHSVDFLSNGEVRNTVAAFCDLAGKLMAEHGSKARTAVSGVRGRVPEQLGRSDSYGADSHHNLTRPRLRPGHVLFDQQWFWDGPYQPQGFHHSSVSFF
jgi:hypothetical protein